MQKIHLFFLESWSYNKEYIGGLILEKLKKELGELDIWALALGAIIGWGCFVLPGTKFLVDAGPLGASIGIVLGALIMMVIAKSYGVMVQRFPVAGGEFTFAYVGFKRKHAFVAAWLLGLSYLSIVPLNATALGLISRYMFPGIIQQGYLYTVAGWDVYLGEIIVASLAIIALTLLNIKGVSLFGTLAKILAFTLSIGIVVLFVFALLNPITEIEYLTPVFSPNKTPWVGILSIVAIAPWAFVGFDTIPQASEEIRFDPKRSLRLMIIAIAIGAMMYVLVTLLTAMVGPWSVFILENSQWATGSAVQLIAGDIGMYILGIVILSAILSGLNGFLLASSRMFLVMARTHALPSVFAEVSKKNHTPHASLLFVMSVSLIAPWIGRAALNWIVDMASLGAAVGFFYTCASAYKLSFDFKEDKQLLRNRPFALLGSLFSILFALLLLIPASPASLSLPSLIALVVWIGLGFVFYQSSNQYKKTNQQEMDRYFGVTSNEE